jgi:hypothetical protein
MVNVTGSRHKVDDQQALLHSKHQELHAWLQSQQAIPKTAKAHVVLPLATAVLLAAAAAVQTAAAAAAAAAAAPTLLQ